MMLYLAVEQIHAAVRVAVFAADDKEQEAIFFSAPDLAFLRFDKVTLA